MPQSSTPTFQQKLGSKPLFPFLLVIFFVMHAVAENYHFDLLKVAWRELAIYLGLALVFFIVFWLALKNSIKAALVVFFLLAFNFFFGSAQDFFKQRFHEPFFMKYSVLMPIVLISFIALFIFLKKTRKNFIALSFYLNAVLLVLIIIDLAGIMSKASHPPKETDLNKSLAIDSSVSKPDIFLIIADEYAGSQTLKEYFKFDNSLFESQLKARGFHVVQDPVSNYNATVYSMSSMFNMDYIRSIKSSKINHRDMLHCKTVIRENSSIDYFKKLGYEFFNYSFFEFADHSPVVFNSFFRQNRKLISGQTFFERAHAQLGYHFVTEKQLRHHYFRNHRNNIECERLLRQNISSQTNKPKFVYTHLAIPHSPYYVDSNGRERKYDDIRNESKDSAAFVDYTIYANKKFLDLIDKILVASKEPPVIILMSDHGFRQFLRPGNERYHFKSLNAVFLPSKNYASFYNGMSNVNQFRALLNDQFGQKLPMLKDSTSYLYE